MTSPLVERLYTELGYPLLDAARLDEFLAANEHSVLFFTGDAATYPETNDVAVILPELMQVFSGRCRAAVIDRASELELQPRFGFLQWPALVLCRRGHCRGVITRVQDWSDYLAEFERLLASDAGGVQRIALCEVGQ